MFLLPTLRQVAAAAALSTLLSGGLFAAARNYQGYGFTAQVFKSSGQGYREFAETGKTMLKVRPNEEYSIVVHNPLPVRAAVAVSVDGLNSIDGQRTSPKDAKKWMIDPYSSITISGWQTGSQTLRKFVFTMPDDSYVQWKENKSGKALARNMGVIGVAWFWNSRELEAALHPPEPFASNAQSTRKEKSMAAGPGMHAQPAPSAAAEDRAGTGMGEQEQHAVTEVAFDENAGMYSVADVMKIFYEFAKEPAEPLPFVSEDEEKGRFAQDMYN